MNAIDKVFGVSPQVLTVRAQRTELISSNLANADTPGYKARDIDFGDTMLRVRGEGEGLQKTNARHLNAHSIGGDGMQSEVLYRMPLQLSLDGNTVETHREHSEFMENAIRYQASLNFLNGRIKSILLALRGE